MDHLHHLTIVDQPSREGPGEGGGEGERERERESTKMRGGCQNVGGIYSCTCTQLCCNHFQYLHVTRFPKLTARIMIGGSCDITHLSGWTSLSFSKSFTSSMMRIMSNNTCEGGEGGGQKKGKRKGGGRKGGREGEDYFKTWE